MEESKKGGKGMRVRRLEKVSTCADPLSSSHNPATTTSPGIPTTSPFPLAFLSKPRPPSSHYTPQGTRQRSTLDQGHNSTISAPEIATESAPTCTISHPPATSSSPTRCNLHGSCQSQCHASGVDLAKPQDDHEAVKRSWEVDWTGGQSQHVPTRWHPPVLCSFPCSTGHIVFRYIVFFLLCGGIAGVCVLLYLAREAVNHADKLQGKETDIILNRVLAAILVAIAAGLSGFCMMMLGVLIAQGERDRAKRKEFKKAVHARDFFDNYRKAEEGRAADRPKQDEQREEDVWSQTGKVEKRETRMRRGYRELEDEGQAEEGGEGSGVVWLAMDNLGTEGSRSVMAGTSNKSEEAPALYNAGRRHTHGVV